MNIPLAVGEGSLVAAEILADTEVSVKKSGWEAFV